MKDPDTLIRVEWRVRRPDAVASVVYSAVYVDADSGASGTYGVCKGSKLRVVWERLPSFSMPCKYPTRRTSADPETGP